LLEEPLVNLSLVRFSCPPYYYPEVSSRISVSGLRYLKLREDIDQFFSLSAVLLHHIFQ